MRNTPFPVGPLATAALAALALLGSACSPTLTPFVASTPGAAPGAPCNVTAPPRVQLFGGFKHPGTLAFEPGLTVYTALQRVGGFEDRARVSELRILRCGRAVGPFPAPAAAGAVTDLPLERGDVVDVPGEMF